MDYDDAPVSPEMSETDHTLLIFGPATPYIGPVDEDNCDDVIQVTFDLIRLAG